MFRKTGGNFRKVTFPKGVYLSLIAKFAETVQGLYTLHVPWHLNFNGSQFMSSVHFPPSISGNPIPLFTIIRQQESNETEIPVRNEGFSRGLSVLKGGWKIADNLLTEKIKDSARYCG